MQLLVFAENWKSYSQGSRWLTEIWRSVHGGTQPLKSFGHIQNPGGKEIEDLIIYNFIIHDYPKMDPL